MDYLKKFEQKVRPFIQPAMFGYLAYFYTETSLETFTDQGELSSQMLGNINRYAMILSMLSALITFAIFITTWFEDPCEYMVEGDKVATEALRDEKLFSRRLLRSTTPVVMSSIFQLLAIYVVGHRLDLPNFDNEESVAAGIITLLVALTSYSKVRTPNDQIVDDNKTGSDRSMFTRILDVVIGRKRTYTMLATAIGGILVLLAWIYQIATGAFVGPWYEAFTIMLLSIMASFGLSAAGGRAEVAGVEQNPETLGMRDVLVESSSKLSQTVNDLRKGITLVFHVFMIFFLSKYLGSSKTADNLVSLGLVIASGVVSVATHSEQNADEAQRVRLNSKTNMVVDLVLRVLHVTVAILSWVALNEMGDSGDLVLYALVRIGVILKLVACFLPTCQLEFLLRNGSTLLLLLPAAALYDGDSDWHIIALSVAVAARAVDAFQNLLIKDERLSLGAITTGIVDRLSALPPAPTFDNPMIYVVVIGLITSSVTLVFAGSEACTDGILDPAAACASFTDVQATCLRIAIALTWTHALLALFAFVVAMFQSRRELAEDFFTTAGYISLSTLELVRTVVSTSVLGLLTYVAHSATVGKPGDSDLATWLYISLFTYIFVDILGRNVV
tara:strand:+ start:7559 stop:9406 length:1848 start_codon:yes stop_codon:yes gene_type:complete